MNAIKKLLCLILALAMLGCMLAGCTQEPANPNGDGTESAGSDGTDDATTDNEDTSSGSDDQIEDPRKTDDHEAFYSFGNGVQEYRILSRSSTAYEFEAAGTGKLSGVEQAIFDRNSAVAERCNVEIVVIPQAGDWVDQSGNTQFVQTVRENALLPNSQYELIATHQAYLSTVVVEGISHDFNDLPNLNLSKVWWSEAYYNEVNHNGAVYMMYGDLAHTLYEYLHVIFFNEQMAEDYNITGLYELALDGDWTFEKMKLYAELVAANEEAADEDRTYGFVTGPHATSSFLSALGSDLAPRNADGLHEFPKSLHVSQTTPLQAYIDLMTANPHTFFCTEAEGNDIFIEGRSLFFSQTLLAAGEFKSDMKQNYGVLPYPKYDEAQKSYVTGIRDSMTAVTVPYNVSNVTLAGTVTDMLSMYGYTEVVDVYYEEKLKYQSFNNPLCVQTLELIRDSFAPSFVMSFSHYLSFANTPFRDAVGKSFDDGVAVDFGASYKQSLATYRRLCRDLYAALDKIAADRAAS